MKVSNDRSTLARSSPWSLSRAFMRWWRADSHAQRSQFAACFAAIHLKGSRWSVPSYLDLTSALTLAVQLTLLTFSLPLMGISPKLINGGRMSTPGTEYYHCEPTTISVQARHRRCTQSPPDYFFYSCCDWSVYKSEFRCFPKHYCYLHHFRFLTA